MNMCKYYGHSKEVNTHQKMGGKFPSQSSKPQRFWCEHEANTKYRTSHKGAKAENVTCEGDVSKCHFPEIWEQK